MVTMELSTCVGVTTQRICANSCDFVNSTGSLLRLGIQTAPWITLVIDGAGWLAGISTRGSIETSLLNVLSSFTLNSTHRSQS